MDGRRRALTIVEGTLAAAMVRRGRFEMTLDEEQAQAWLAVINDARLALGTRLGSPRTRPVGARSGRSGHRPYAVYWWLGVIEERLIDALL